MSWLLLASKPEFSPPCFFSLFYSIRFCIDKLFNARDVSMKMAILSEASNIDIEIKESKKKKKEKHSENTMM
jgi:hypothetical protein